MPRDVVLRAGVRHGRRVASTTSPSMLTRTRLMVDRLATFRRGGSDCGRGQGLHRLDTPTGDGRKARDHVTNRRDPLRHRFWHHRLVLTSHQDTLLVDRLVSRNVRGLCPW